MRVFRICQTQYASSSFSGLGGLHGPGRWHHKGNRIVYTSDSLSLATLETWVHVQPKLPLSDHIAVWADISDDLLVHSVDPLPLPPDWRSSDDGPIEILRDIGTNWLGSRVSAVACVPATTTFGEFNFLINPLHHDFQRILTGEPEPFAYDPRMWK